MIIINEEKCTSVVDIANLKKEMKSFYDNHLKGKTVKNEHKGISIIFSSTGRNHVLYARAVGFEKLIAIKKLAEMVREAVYCNFKEADQNDSKDILGYMNFKVDVCINQEVCHFRIVVRLTKNGKFFYDHSVKIKKADTR
jgi:hypothetical protein